ncbi:SEC-C metal-binding domain-containing protein [Bacillus weihaiensis]|uniref:SEC-C metal-binding domain-containing protein n=1 Tax=Bacillus weihaiensis TaxID=1547283 RepID=UPI002357A199|nr:SEC-C metal-binding domain-containing protein [Bacillus weihaiensis]
MRQFDKVTDITIKTLIASALCSQLSTRAIPILEDFTKENYAHSLLNLKEDFYACFIINQIDHPKLSEWKQELNEGLLQREGKNNRFSLFSKPAKSEKVGRNEPCPCGSGKKYKKCCG